MAYFTAFFYIVLDFPEDSRVERGISVFDEMIANELRKMLLNTVARQVVNMMILLFMLFNAFSLFCVSTR